VKLWARRFVSVHLLESRTTHDGSGHACSTYTKPAHERGWCAPWASSSSWGRLEGWNKSRRPRDRPSFFQPDRPGRFSQPRARQYRVAVSCRDAIANVSFARAERGHGAGVAEERLRSGDPQWQDAAALCTFIRCFRQDARRLARRKHRMRCSVRRLRRHHFQRRPDAASTLKEYGEAARKTTPSTPPKPWQFSTRCATSPSSSPPSN